MFRAIPTKMKTTIQNSMIMMMRKEARDVMRMRKVIMADHEVNMISMEVLLIVETREIGRVTSNFQEEVLGEIVETCRVARVAAVHLVEAAVDMDPNMVEVQVVE